jgi:hypothetical protein
MLPFIYRSLDEARSEIRLLRIRKRKRDRLSSVSTTKSSLESYDQLLSCNLECASLHDRPKYTALSYVWGDASDTLPILLGGHRIQITRSLSEALHQLVLDPTIGQLWVDAICINQQDDQEMGWQVSIMGSIYNVRHLF